MHSIPTLSYGGGSSRFTTIPGDKYEEERSRRAESWPPCRCSPIRRDSPERMSSSAQTTSQSSHRDAFLPSPILWWRFIKVYHDPWRQIRGRAFKKGRVVASLSLFSRQTRFTRKNVFFRPDNFPVNNFSNFPKARIQNRGPATSKLVLKIME